MVLMLKEVGNSRNLLRIPLTPASTKTSDNRNSWADIVHRNQSDLPAWLSTPTVPKMNISDALVVITRAGRFLHNLDHFAVQMGMNPSKSTRSLIKRDLTFY